MYFFRLICLFASSAALSNAIAFDQLSFSIEQAEISGWQIENLDIKFDIAKGVSSNTSTEKVPQLIISINKLKSMQGETFKEIKIECPLPSLQNTLQFNLIECQSGYFSAEHKQLGQLKGQINLLFDVEKRQGELSISQLRIAKGLINITAKIHQEKWHVALKGQSLSIARLKKIAASFITIPDITSDESGRINIELIANGQAAELRSAKIKLRTFDLAFNGDSVAEELDAKLNIFLHKHGDEWRIKEELALLDGAIYLESGLQIGALSPGFLFEPEQEPITLVFDADWRNDRIKIYDLVLDHPQVLTANINGTLYPQQDTPVDNLSLSFNTQDLGTVFPIYIQPLLFGSGLDEMEITGRTNLDIKLEKSGISDFHLILGEVYAEDKAGRFHLAGLDGDIRLNSDPNVKDSGIRWRGGSIYKMNIGGGEMKLSSKGRSMKLREKMLISIFDGELQVHNLEMKNLGLEDYSIHIESKLTPITLAEFTEALGWPIMAGNISGEIPGMTYHKGNLSTEGKLRVSVFDGDISISQLRIDDLFDLIPTLYADIAVDNLDLGVLTKTFEFGDITGKLGGYIHDLRLDNWQLVNFDARFETPKNDKSRHRISQRAIDNLTSIGGGGGTDVISRGIMGIFEDFPYSKIGLSCKLEDSICHMKGVEKTAGGYYIVKHGLLPPWLNIKGFNHKVDWQDLLERLKNISNVDGPTVE